jgi:DNA-binding NarL/FixJ family response regulator
VVDDEQLAREELCFLLGQMDGVDVSARPTNGVEALEAIGASTPTWSFSTSRCPA